MSKFIEVQFGSEGPKGENGDKGDAATVAVGTVTTLPAGSPATVENTGTSSAAVLNFGIPKGQKGDTGAAGADGQDGADGADGKSAYQQAVEGGYTGTEEQFKALLAGIDGYLPKVFDGAQTVTPKTAGDDVVLNFDNNDEYQNRSCKAMLKIFESYGLQLHLLKDENGTWKSCGELRLGKDGEIKLTNLINSSEIKITDDGRIYLSTATGKDAYLNYRQILTAADKGVNGGVASLGNDGKVPAAQLPDIDNALSSSSENAVQNKVVKAALDNKKDKVSITALGSVSSAITLSTNTNYTATLSGSAAFTLPTPSDTSVSNTITLLLNVTSASTIDWDVNANVAMTTFSVGKYLIRLRYNNATSNWIGEVLKGESVPGTTKAYFSFNDGYADETGNITLTPYSGYTPVFSSEYTAFTGRKSLEVGNNVNTKYFIPSGFNNIILSGPFNIRFWVQKDTIGHNALTILNYVSPGGISYNLLEIFDTYFKFKAATDAQASTIQNVLYPQDLSLVLTNKMHYIEVSRDSNNTVRLFVDGVVKGSSSYSNDIYLPANEALFSAQMWYIQDFAIENQVGHTSDYDVPTTPYSISEQSLPDYHDSTKQNSLNNTQLSAVNSGIDTTKVTQISTNTTDISTINGKIPAQATSSNQLADKNFVNSSIATNTANFIGTFNSLADLQAYSGTVTNNDYAFVIDTDTAGNTLYERYKYNGTSWVFEYALNNSGFTAAQWAAINSGITAALVSLIATALQSVPYATASRVGGIRIEKDTVNGIINIIDED